MSQYFQFRVAFQGLFGLLIETSTRRFIQIVFAALLAHMGGHALDDNQRVASFQHHCNLSGYEVTCLANRTFHGSLFLLKSSVQRCGSGR